MRSTTIAGANGRAKPSCARRDKEFTIRGTQDCLARGFDRTGYFEVDTGEQRSWTVQLTETADDPQRRPLTPGAPMLPTPGRREPSQLPMAPTR